METEWTVTTQNRSFRTSLSRHCIDTNNQPHNKTR